MSIQTIIIFLTIFISVVFDAIRDSGVERKSGVGWWQWHISKWIAFYSPLVLLSYFYFVDAGITMFSVLQFVAFALICFFTWRGIYR